MRSALRTAETNFTELNLLRVKPFRSACWTGDLPRLPSGTRRPPRAQPGQLSIGMKTTPAGHLFESHCAVVQLGKPLDARRSADDEFQVDLGNVS
jgi:hypothetical protein